MGMQRVAPETMGSYAAMGGTPYQSLPQGNGSDGTMSQLALFETATPTPPAPRLSAEERCNQWIKRQSCVYTAVVMEIEKRIAGGLSPICLHDVFVTIAGRSTNSAMAARFTGAEGFCMDFDIPLAAKIVGFHDVEAKHILQAGQQ